MAHRRARRGSIRARAFQVCLSLVLGSVPALAEEQGPLRIATEGAFPPFNYVENNEPHGFEVELGKALCEAMRRTCVFALREWDGMIKGLLRGEYDAIMASLAITEKRKARIAFSRPYYRIPATLIARKDAEIAGVAPAALAGKSIATTVDSEHARFLEERYPGSVLKTYGKFEDANLELLTDRVDVVLGDKIAMMKFLDSREGRICCRLIGDLPFDPMFYGAGIGVGLRTADAALKAALDRALGDLFADGTYDRIRAKYFAFDIKG